MADIFGVTPVFGGAFSMDLATLTFGGATGADGLGYLVQSVSAQYTRPIQRVFELGPHKTTYYVTGRSEGRMQIARLAAPAPVNARFLTDFGDVCKVASNNLVITVNPGVNGNCAGNGVLNSATASRYTFNYCLIETLQLSMAVQQIALNENLSLVFAGMSSDGTP